MHQSQNLFNQVKALKDFLLEEFSRNGRSVDEKDPDEKYSKLRRELILTLSGSSLEKKIPHYIVECTSFDEILCMFMGDNDELDRCEAVNRLREDFSELVWAIEFGQQEPEESE